MANIENVANKSDVYSGEISIFINNIMTLSRSRQSSGPLVEIFPISLDAVVDLLEILEDTSSVADPVEVVVFRNDRDAVHYRLRWENALDLIDNIWTIPPGTSANSWIAQNAPDSDLGEWASVWFPTAKRRERFWSALMASEKVAPDDGSMPKSEDETRPHGAVSSLSSPE